MSYENSLLRDISTILESESPEELKSFKSDLRDSMNTSARLSRVAMFFMLTVFVSHYLLSNGHISEVNIQGFSLKDSQFLQIGLLGLASLSFVASLLADFMWRCHRETYDWIHTLEKSQFSKTSLLSFRLPPSYSGALDLLRDDGSITSKVVSNFFRYVWALTSFGFPFAYILTSLLTMLKELWLGSHWLPFLIAMVMTLVLLAASYIVWRSAQLSNPARVVEGWQKPENEANQSTQTPKDSS